MNARSKKKPSKAHHYDQHDQLDANLADLINANNYTRRLKTVKVSHNLRLHLQLLGFPAKTIQT
ncbi:hypothetical protein ACVWZ6_002534 [Bradyrhizobium sp. GM6.1]